MLGKIVLWLSAAIFGSYGIACLLDPSLAAGYAGLDITNGDAYAEMGAMYGGLQTGFGILCLLGALQAWMRKPALTMIVVMVGGLAVTRGFWMLAGTEPVGVYTQGALVFEAITTVVAAVALRQSSD
ncbi:MAG: DUF4345 family protein [Halioglobus sp.]